LPTIFCVKFNSRPWDTPPTSIKESTPMKALIAVLAAAAVSPAFADANLDLATKKSCLACHAIDKKLIGPAYKDVAAKYAGQKDAVAKLSEKVIHGGAGTWGPVAMPANAVTPEEAKQLVTWVLNQK
jgi:cytochrome c